MYSEFAWAEDVYTVSKKEEANGKPSKSDKSASGNGHSAFDAQGIAQLPSLHYREHLTCDLYYDMPVLKTLFSDASPFQTVQILQTKHFGKVLILDNKMQSAQSDEALYHESLVHPALLSHPCPKRVFIGGGGEGATLREVLKHKTVEEVVMVDIDEVAVRMCQKNLPEWNAGVWTDPRVTFVYDDALKYLCESKESKFDVIIMDISDPIEAGPGWVLYSKEFYEDARDTHLTDQSSILVTQSTACSVNMITEGFTVIHNTLKKVFKKVCPYKVDIPSFGAPWGFQLCSQSSTTVLDAQADPAHIDALLLERLGEDGVKGLKHYDGECHRHMLSLCKYERQACKEETRVLTQADPIFVA